MTPDEILEVDAKRNHPPGTVAGHLRAEINGELQEGGKLIRHKDVLIVYKPISKSGVVEYHTFNADSPDNLIDAVKQFAFLMKKAGAKVLKTTYRNAKINDLFAQAKPEFDITITKKDGIFTSEARL
jgi:hypothetical protein